MENHHFLWENQLKWPFSIAMLNYQRVYDFFCPYCDARLDLSGNVGGYNEPKLFGQRNASSWLLVRNHHQQPESLKL